MKTLTLSSLRIAAVAILFLMLFFLLANTLNYGIALGGWLQQHNI